MGHDPHTGSHPHDALYGRVVEQRAVVAHLDHGADDGVVSRVEVIADVHVAVDDRTLPKHGVLTDAGRPAIRMVAVSYHHIGIDQGALADNGIRKLTGFAR